MSQDVTAALVDSRTIRTDGHVNGEHDAMVFCFESKNELSTTNNKPCAELVAYVASSLANLMKSAFIYRVEDAMPGYDPYCGCFSRPLHLRSLTKGPGTYIRF